jgi:hypothetical protein
MAVVEKIGEEGEACLNMVDFETRRTEQIRVLHQIQVAGLEEMQESVVGTS